MRLQPFWQILFGFSVLLTGFPLAPRAIGQSSALEIYFNSPLPAGLEPNSVYTGGQLFSAAIVDMVDQAEISVDVASYNFDHTPLLQALNRAHARGVRVRFVRDEETSNPSLNSAPAWFVATRNDEGLMHHKFIVVDAEDGTRAAVMTGSTNFTDANIYRFYNNSILLRDSVIARAYAAEFNTLWGGQGAIPHGPSSSSGEDKPSNPPTTTSIEGTDIEVYFSPTGEVSDRIAELVRASREEILFSLLIFTYQELAESLSAARSAGVEVVGIIENWDDSSSKYNYLQGRGIDVTAHTHEEVLHHKYAVIDAADPTLAAVVTGSHNWTYSAETYNDENTLILRGNSSLAAIYRAYFLEQRCEVLGGVDCQLTSPTVSASPENPLRLIRTGGEVLLDARNIDALQISDPSGRLLYASAVDPHQSRHTLALRHLPSGLYFLSAFRTGQLTGSVPFHQT